MNKIFSRLTSVLLCLVLLFTLAACDPATKVNPTNPSNTLASDCVHTDSDNNNFCDKCNGNLLVELDFYAINDIHGKFNDSASQPGVDELTTYLKDQGKNAILLSSGDTWQGSSESNLTYGALMTEWMNELDFVAMTLGNHEFDWGEEYIEANAELAEFPLLAINVYDRKTNQRVDYCDASVMIQRSGINIGIIGAIGDCYSSISGDKTEDIYFLTGSKLTELVKQEAETLRSQGADIIVYSLHDGSERVNGNQQDLSSGSYYDPALSDGYVDLVFEGHTHQLYTFKDQHGVYHLQGGGENSNISHAKVYFNIVTEHITVSANAVSNRVYGECEPHGSIQNLLDKYADQIALGDKTVGVVGQYMSSDEIKQLAAELYYKVAEARWGQQYDIVLAGGLISVRNPYNIPAGEVKYSQLQSVLPFDNQIVLCSVQGNILRDRFMETDDERYAIYCEEYGEALRDNIDPNATYYIVTDTYTSSYKPNRLTVVAEYDPGVYARDLLADYIGEGHLAPPTGDNIVLTDIPTILEIGAGLPANNYSADSYFVKGTVVSIQNTTYGNLTIVDENGNELYIYGVNDANGVRYDQMENAPQVGDTVILYGRIQHYFPQSGDPIIELVRTNLISQ